MNADLDLLKRKPTIAEITALLHSIPAPSLELTTNLINYTIPEVYRIAPEIRTTIVASLQSVIGIGNLLSRLLLVKNDSEITDLYSSVLSEVFSIDLAVILMNRSPTQLEIKEIDKLIFKGKALAVMNEVGSKFKPFDHFGSYLQSQLLSLFKHSIDPKILQKFVLSSMSINSSSPEHICSMFLTESNIPYFDAMLRCMNKVDKKRIMSHLVVYLKKHISEDTICAYYTVLSTLDLCIDSSIVEAAIRHINYPLNRLIVLLTPKSIVPHIISNWADEARVKSEPIAIQMSRTHFLLTTLTQNDPKIASEMLTSHEFLEAVSNRLQSFSETSRALGMLVANHVCKIAGREVIFKVDISSYEYLIEDAISSPTIDVSTAWTKLSLNKEPKPEESKLPAAAPHLHKKLEILSIQDSDDETDDEDPSVMHKSKIPDPVYIKQLLEYLTEDDKNPRAYDMKYSALKHGSTLIRQKFTSEVAFFGNDLLTNLIALVLDDQKQSQLRFQVMVSVIVRYPPGARHVCSLLETGDYSLQQRMTLLSVLSASARELRGLDDKIVAYEERQFPSKMLPEDLHHLYSNEPIKTIQNELMHSIQEETGTIVRKSTKLTRKDQPRAAANDFFKIVTSDFYFPLVNLWYKSDGARLDIGHYTPLFIAHFITTLNLILHAAFPTALNLFDMIKEHLGILTSVLKVVEMSQSQTIESIATGIMIVLEITDRYKEFAEPLFFVQNWLITNIDNLMDERLKSLCAGLLLRLSQIDSSMLSL